MSQPRLPTLPPRGGPAAVGLTLLGVLAALLAALGQLTAWGYNQLRTATDHAGPWLVAGLLVGVVIGVPALLVWRYGRHRIAVLVGRTWAFGSGLLLLLTPLRLLPSTSSSLDTVIAAAAVAAAAFGLSRTAAFRVARAGGDGGTLVAAAAGLLTLLPWAFYGALGGIVDTICSAALAAALGWFAALLLRPLWQAAAAAWTRTRFVLVGGLAGGVLLLLLATGVGPRFSGVALLACLPPVAFCCAAVSYQRPRAMPTFAGVAVTAFGPLAFLDPDEVTVLLGELSGAVKYAFLATGIGVLVGLAASALFAPLARVLWSRAFAAGVTALALIAAGAVYGAAGEPGFTGERLFVVLRAQAPLTGVTRIKDLTHRRSVVYHRLVRLADRTQRPLRKALDRIGVGYRPYYLVNALEVDAGAELRPWLASRDNVREVLASPQLRPIRELPPPTTGHEPRPTGPDWNLSMVRADEVWSQLHVRGKGVVVGQSDSGVDGSHPELAGSYRGRGGNNDYNWLDPWYGSSSPHDWGGHGTHTLGTAVGKHVGVAPGATWIGCVNLARNLGNPGVYLNCMQFMLAPYPQGGDPFRDGDPAKAADVLNNSWGCPPREGCDATVLGHAVRALTAAGIFVVASAGNDGPACGTVADPIALFPGAFTVGAVDDRGDVAPFSSRGPVTADGSDRHKPDIAAPGVDVLSSLPGGGYGRLSGTSMAGPHVVGTVALMWSANPKLKGDVARTARILQSTAQPAALSDGPSCGGKRNEVGAGIVDAYAAVKAAERLRTR